jgi:DNA (cytosine-5)-methyltransferase 1
LRSDWSNMTVGSLFAGIGGFDLGLERAGFEITWQVEIDPYCQRVLAKHWPHVKRYGDIRTIDWGSVEPVDIVCGGFPCQPVSLAGKRLAQQDERWLWPEFFRCLRILRPSYALVENVPGLLVHGLGDVLAGLAEIGMHAEWQVLSAAQFGAPHLRERVWIVAYAPGKGLERWPWATETAWHPLPESPRISWVSARHPRPRSNNGLPLEVDRRRALGNAIVPQIAEWLGRQIKEASKGHLTYGTQKTFQALD